MPLKQTKLGPGPKMFVKVSGWWFVVVCWALWWFGSCCGLGVIMMCQLDDKKFDVEIKIKIN